MLLSSDYASPLRHPERSRGTRVRGRRGRSRHHPPRSLDYARDDSYAFTTAFLHHLVEREVLAHHAEPDHAEGCFCHLITPHLFVIPSVVEGPGCAGGAADRATTRPGPSTTLGMTVMPSPPRFSPPR